MYLPYAVLLGGLTCILFAFCRCANLLVLISSSVMIGFVNGLAIIISLSQVQSPPPPPPHVTSDVFGCESWEWGLARGDREGPLNEAQRLHFRGVHVALATANVSEELGGRELIISHPIGPIRIKQITALLSPSARPPHAGTARLPVAPLNTECVRCGREPRCRSSRRTCWTAFRGASSRLCRPRAARAGCTAPSTCSRTASRGLTGTSPAGCCWRCALLTHVVASEPSSRAPPTRAESNKKTPHPISPAGGTTATQCTDIPQQTGAP
jgi:hypothetical protein